MRTASASGATCSTDSSTGDCGSPSSRRYAAPSNTSTTLVESRRRTTAVRSSRYGGRTGTTASVTERLRRVPRDVRTLLAHQPAHHAGVPGELHHVGGVHRDLPCHRYRRAVGDAAELPVDQRLGLQADGVHVRAVDARTRPAQQLPVHRRQRAGVRARGALRPLPRAAARPAVPDAHRAAADHARRADPRDPVLLRGDQVRGRARRLDPGAATYRSSRSAAR